MSGHALPISPFGMVVCAAISLLVFALVAEAVRQALAEKETRRRWEAVLLDLGPDARTISGLPLRMSVGDDRAPVVRAFTVFAQDAASAGHEWLGPVGERLGAAYRVDAVVLPVGSVTVAYLAGIGLARPIAFMAARQASGEVEVEALPETVSIPPGDLARRIEAMAARVRPSK